MLRLICILFFLLNITVPIYAQSNNSVNEELAHELVTLYNEGKYAAIANLFSDNMHEALPKDKALEFFSQVNNQYGKIRTIEIINLPRTGTSYKADAEKGRMMLNISSDDEKKLITGLYIKPYIEDNNVTQRNMTKLMFPLRGEWSVVWGGDTKDLNYHVESLAQKNAFDFIILDELGKSYKTDGSRNEDYYAFGQEILAPCNASVVFVVDGIKDNIPGELNLMYIPGNSVMLKTDNEYIFFAHFKQNSIKVKEGQKMKKGEVLGLCGNSGRSTEAHLHFHLQNSDNLSFATGIKCYFENITINGEFKAEHSPVRYEKIKSEK